MVVRCPSSVVRLEPYQKQKNKKNKNIWMLSSDPKNPVFLALLALARSAGFYLCRRRQYFSLGFPPCGATGSILLAKSSFEPSETKAILHFS
jgi:hypothetical protein